MRTKPSLVKDLKNYTIVKVACGAKHTLFLTCKMSHSSFVNSPRKAHGEIFACGRGNEGQLGVGDKEDRKWAGEFFVTDVSMTSSLHHMLIVLVLIQQAWGKPVIDVAAGEGHSVCLTVSGNVYTWGRFYFNSKVILRVLFRIRFGYSVLN